MTTDMLYQILRGRIQDGSYAVNQPLPTEALLQNEFKAARGTVRAALQRLLEEGYLSVGEGRKRLVQRKAPLRMARLRISSKQDENGRRVTQVRSSSFGTYLKRLELKPRDDVIRAPIRIPCHALSEEPRFSATEVARELRIDLDDEVYWIERLRLADEEPLTLQWAVIPVQILQRGQSPREFMFPGGLTEFYRTQGIERRRVVTAYMPTRASKTEADFLRLGAAGAPLIEERRVSSFEKHAGGKLVPYEYLISLYTERVALTFDWVDPISEQPRKRIQRPPTGEPR